MSGAKSPSEQWTNLHRSRSGRKRQPIIHNSAETLIAPYVALGSLHGSVPQKKLDLLQFTTRGVT
jgi:hypothetical protein